MSLSSEDQAALTSAQTGTKRLLNSQLKDICREQSLPVSGVKASLQHRIQQRLSILLDQGEVEAFHKLCQRISPHAVERGSAPNGYMPRVGGYPDRYEAGYKANNNQLAPSTAYPGTYGDSSYSRPNATSNGVKFPDTPFHEILQPLSRNTDLPVVHQNRHNVTAPFTLGFDRVSQMQNDSSLRVLIYCTSDLSSNQPDIAFPSQIEIKVNDEPFQGNLRGIKKKTGTTRPADITHLVRKLPNYQNKVVVTYAATDKKFTCVVNFVKKHAVEELVSKIRQGHVITKQTVINEMASKANDADILATSTVMSLKCPLSAMRLSLPCRSVVCNHNQCFDAESFLLLQEQAPQWSCPICNKIFSFNALAVDEYVQDILQRFPQSTEQVTIEPDGTVMDEVSTNGTGRPGALRMSSKRPDAYDQKADEQDAVDDDIIEIGGGSSNGIKIEPNSASNTLLSYRPSPSSRLSSAPTLVEPSTTSAKRKQTEVVDLTLSSDDDDGEPPRPPVKRQSTGSGTNSSLSSLLPSLGPKPPLDSSTRPSNPPSLTKGYGHYARPSPLPFPGQSTPARPPAGPSITAPSLQSPSWHPPQPSPYSHYNSYSSWGHHR